eukprot:CAMPEP_0119412232 /NCGR_PEP_ID=MMETSP1335-20130426/4735_1 /TAXON_ID=259385 /ORGANISM="Chrysoculter rhomboideus, Strain RCC1486" /LENGTH=506 /DNA_ID=CAMNT_0007436953 /DNA_START=62 /DNA_END=1582 /DNA_ORIENTATION=+
MLNALSLRLRGSSARATGSESAPATDLTPPHQPSSSNELVTLSASGEVGAVAASNASSVLAMASVRAGEPPASSTNRTPLELVAVADVSGSMSGEKMTLMKEALSFVVKQGLQAGDSFGLVTFASEVDVELKVTSMDVAGKKQAQRMIDGLHTKGQTNLSGGLLQGLDLLAGRSKAAGTGAARAVTRSVILFTDGMANVGITETGHVVAAAHQALPAIDGGCSIFTFGFGSSHNEDMLRALSEVSPGGQYFFTKTAEEIPVAFADALGGLVSVVAQNVELRIAPGAPGVRVERLLGADGYAHELAPDGSALLIKLGDLYAEDEKDLLVSLHIPAIGDEDAHDEARPQLALSLRYFDVSSTAYATVDTTLALARPKEAPTTQEPNEALEVQRHRVHTAEALDRASKMADAGELEAGRALLNQIKKEVACSPVAASKEHSKTCEQLVLELETISEKYESRAAYESEGRFNSKMACQTHMVQRSAMGSGAVYEKKSKLRMKEAWRTSAH